MTECTILIPSYLDPRRALRAAEVARLSADHDPCVIVVDDGSPGDPWSGIDLPRHLTLVRRSENGGFAACVNTGLDRIPEGDVVLLNSDVLLAPGWYRHVRETAERFEVGLVGIRLHYPNGIVQHAGGCPAMGGWVGHLGDGDAMRHLYAERYGCFYVTGAFWWWKRSTIDSIGVLDPEYRNGAEDVDYCLRVWRAGLLVMYDGRAHGIHAAGATRKLAGLSIGVEPARHISHFRGKHWPRAAAPSGATTPPASPSPAGGQCG